MAAAQGKLVAWAEAKVAEHEAEETEIKVNLDAAVAHKWRSSGLKSQHTRAGKRTEYYRKMLAALQAGYSIVPNLPGMDTFAVRVKRRPPEQEFGSRWRFEQNANAVTVQELPPGEGEYKDPVPASHTEQREGEKPGTKELVTIGDGEWDDVDFPAIMAKPQIISATEHAMDLKIFDRMCISPGVRRKGDPMVIGQIVTKNGYTNKVVSFLVAWFIDTKAL